MGFLPGGSVRRALGAVFGGMFAACLAVACSASPGTGFLVRVSSQLPLAEIVLRVHDSQDRVVHCGKHAVNRAGVTTGIDLPASLGVIPEDPAATTDVRVVALAFTTANVSDPCAEGAVLAPRVRAEALVSYVPGSVLELPLPFSLSCLDVDCPGQVCRHGTCTDTRVDPKRLARLAEGDVDGTGCSRLSECGRSVVLAPTPDRCVFDLPAGEPVDRIVPFVTYDFGDGTLAASEFLDVADYELSGSAPGSSLSLGGRLCEFVDRGYVRVVGGALPCAVLDGRPPCSLADPSNRPPEIDLDAGGASRDAGLDGALHDATVDDGGDAGPPPDGSRDGSGEGGHAGAGDGQVSDGAADGSGDSGGSGGDSGSDGGSVTACGATCCGLCDMSGFTPRCERDFGLGPSEVRHDGIAVAGEDLAWIGSNGTDPYLVVARPNAMNASLLGNPIPHPVGIVSGGATLALARFADVGTSRIAVDFRPTSNPMAPPFTWEAARGGYAPLVTADAFAVYVLFFALTGEEPTPGWVLHRLQWDGASTVQDHKVYLDAIGGAGVPVRLVARDNRVVLAFDEGTLTSLAVAQADGTSSQTIEDPNDGSPLIDIFPYFESSSTQFVVLRKVGNSPVAKLLTVDNAAAVYGSLGVAIASDVTSASFAGSTGVNRYLFLGSAVDRTLDLLHVVGGARETITTATNPTSIRSMGSCIFHEEGDPDRHVVGTFMAPLP